MVRHTASAVIVQKVSSSSSRQKTVCKQIRQLLFVLT